ncbi:Uncharacterised protein [Kingella potus]|uniref:Uncharacterized protein n=1 Tax=Kingella potus TaxID=265175 RepID=A0A377R1Y1_9NEIS|nr:Uncharacterised protein [Kingella potus]
MTECRKIPSGAWPKGFFRRHFFVLPIGATQYDMTFSGQIAQIFVAAASVFLWTRQVGCPILYTYSKPLATCFDKKERQSYQRPSVCCFHDNIADIVAKRPSETALSDGLLAICSAESCVGCVAQRRTHSPPPALQTSIRSRVRRLWARYPTFFRSLNCRAKYLTQIPTFSISPAFPVL